MDKALIYICYDPFAYTNFFSLAINGQKVCDVVPEEQMGELFLKCEELNVSKLETKWCIVQDEDARKWDYDEEIKSRGYKVNPLKISLSELTTTMNHLFDKDFVIAPNQDVTKKNVQVIYPVAITEDEPVCDQRKALNDAENILNNAGMTELAKIIREKYERMNKHE